MREHHDRRAVGNGPQVIFDPFELFVAELAKAAFANVHHIVQANKVRAFVIEAEPAAAFGSFAEALEVLFAIVIEHIVFARHVENLFGFASLENLFERVELFGLGKMRQVAGVEDELRRRGQGVDLGDRLLQRAEHVLVRFLVEPDVTVADLHERKVSGNGRFGFCCDDIGWPQNAGGKDAARTGPKHPRAGPGHAFEKAAPVEAIRVMIVQDEFRFGSHIFRLFAVLHHAVQDSRRDELFQRN